MARFHPTIEHIHPNTSRMNYWEDIRKLRMSYYVGLYAQNGYDAEEALRAANTIDAVMTTDIWVNPNLAPEYKRNTHHRLARPKTVLSFDDDRRPNGYIYYADEATSDRGFIGATVEELRILHTHTEKQKNRRTRVILEAIMPTGEASFGLQAVMLGVALRNAGHGPFEYCVATGERIQEDILIDAGARWDVDAEAVPILPSLPGVSRLPIIADDASELYDAIAGVKGSHMHDMVEAARHSAYNV